MLKQSQEVSSANWYIIRTKANAEKKVYERLKQLEIETLFPTYTTLRQWSDRKKKIQVPYIPGYLFVHTNPTEFKLIYTTPGFSSFLHEFGKPATMREDEIKNIRILCNLEIQDSVEIQHQLVKGDEVLITEGPFKGLIGIVKQNSKGSKVYLIFKQINLTLLLNSNDTKEQGISPLAN